jgi:hypothetical protein
LQCLILRLNIIPYQNSYLRCVSSTEAAYQEKRKVVASVKQHLNMVIRKATCFGV